jgi:hypothetical protein
MIAICGVENELAICPDADCCTVVYQCFFAVNQLAAVGLLAADNFLAQFRQTWILQPFRSLRKRNP